MYRLIPAILTIATAFLIPAPVAADQVEAEAILATADCIPPASAIVDVEERYAALAECFEASLAELTRISPDVSFACEPLWQFLWTHYSSGYFAVTIDPDIIVTYATWLPANEYACFYGPTVTGTPDA